MQIHDGDDYCLGCECDGCRHFRERAKAANMTPFQFLQHLAAIERQRCVPVTNDTGTFELATGKPLEPMHKRVGLLDVATGTMRSERDSTEADAAQVLFTVKGVPSYLMIEIIDQGASMAQGLACWPKDGQRQAPMHKRVGRVQRNTQSLTCPLAIMMLMHFYAVREPFIDRPFSQWPPAQRGIVEGFKAKGLIFERGPEDYETSDKGSLVVETLKAAMKEGLRNV